MKKKVIDCSLLTVSVICYVVAICLGFKNGVLPLCFLGVANIISFLSMVNALASSYAWQSTCFRLMLVCFTWSGIFSNQENDTCTTIMASIAFIILAVLIVWAIYYANTYIKRDTEKELNEL